MASSCIVEVNILDGYGRVQFPQYLNLDFKTTKIVCHTFCATDASQHQGWVKLVCFQSFHYQDFQEIFNPLLLTYIRQPIVEVQTSGQIAPFLTRGTSFLEFELQNSKGQRVNLHGRALIEIRGENKIV